VINEKERAKSTERFTLKEQVVKFSRRVSSMIVDETEYRRAVEAKRTLRNRQEIYRRPEST
jgi:hypothetical protein